MTAHDPEKWEPVFGKDHAPKMTSAYVVVPAKSIEPEHLMRFADVVWPDRPRERILAAWWRRAAPEWGVAALDPTGRMVGVCAGRPATWTIEGRDHPAVAICDWYVDPNHEGRLLGRRLLRRFETPERLLYAYSMSDVAAAYLGRLGWSGPHATSLLALPLPRLARVPLALLRPRGGLDLEEHVLAGGGALGSLAADFDRIEANNATARARMRRGGKEWAWRLEVCGERQYHVCLARRAGAPVGYVVVRRITPGASRILGRHAGAIITDLVAAGDDPAVLRALARRAAAIAARLQVVVVLMATNSAAQRRALAASAFLSSRWPVLDRFLGRAAPTFMWSLRGPGASLAPDDFALTFADSDVDLNL
jgi:Acetyltransferase (GNAT) domain